MNDLVKRLSEKTHFVETLRPEKTAKALKECIDRKYVHIMFKETGTEIGIRLDEKKCDLSNADFSNNVGKVHLEGVLTLNYHRVRCIAEVDISNLDGEGKLQAVEDSDYDEIIKQAAY